MSRRSFRLRRLLFQGSSWRALLEAWILAVLVFCLIFFVVDELPEHNLPAAFLFLSQIPVGWAALRRVLPSPPFTWRSAGREAAFAFGLQALVLGTASGLAYAFHQQDTLRWDTAGFGPVSLILTTCALPYLVYRLLIALLVAWRSLTGRRILWMMVNMHLVTVFTLIMLASFISRIGTFNDAAAAYYPSGLLAYLVLEFVRAVVPWVGLTILFALAIMAAFFLPTLLTSYLAARPFVQRISELAAAMEKLRQGDHSVRVKPSGKDEIAQLQDDFNHMAAELQREREKVALLLKNQRELAAVVSHELRTPVTVMRAYVENDLFENPDPLPESYRADLQTIHHETLKLQGLVEDLFTLSQMDANRLDMACRWTDGAGVVERVAGALKKVAWEHNRIELCTQRPPGLPAIWADEDRLEQVLNNLVQNAIRHTPPGGVILMQANAAGEWLEIEVIDSGDGIAPEDLPHLWERFYRGGQGRRSGRTGIGLSLVKELVENMGGTVGVESRPGEGSRFWLRLKAKNSP